MLSCNTLREQAFASIESAPSSKMLWSHLDPNHIKTDNDRIVFVHEEIAKMLNNMTLRNL